jgi:hypothetical protein
VSPILLKKSKVMLLSTVVLPECNNKTDKKLRERTGRVYQVGKNGKSSPASPIFEGGSWLRNP